MKNINEYIKNWSEKMSISEKEIQIDYNELLLDEHKIHADLSEDDKTTRALQRLAMSYKKQLRSPAVGFEGIIIGVGDAVDIVAKQRREAIELYKLDPLRAVDSGVTDEEGTPLDARKEWASGKTNIGYGKPLPEHNWLKNVYGIAIRTNSKDIPKLFTISLSGDKAISKEEIPMFKPVRFMAIDRTPSDAAEKIYMLNSSIFTTFKEDKELSLPKSEALIKNIGKDIFVDIKNLNTYHNKTKDIINRIVIVEGNVSGLNLEPTSFGSRIMNIEDETTSLENLDAKGVTCWLPERTKIDFAEGSKVLVIGRTAQGKKKNEFGTPTEELGDVSINVYGVYAIPEFRINPPEEVLELTEEDIN